MLLGAAVVTNTLQHWVDTVVILAVTIVNAVLGLIQEGKAEKAMEAIRGMAGLIRLRMRTRTVGAPASRV